MAFVGLHDDLLIGVSSDPVPSDRPMPLEISFMICVCVI